MLIRRRKGWEISERHATPEHLFFARRTVLKGAAATAVAGVLGASGAFAAAAPDPSLALYPAKRNESFTLDREVTPEIVNSHYNNFYEFGSGKEGAEEKLHRTKFLGERLLRFNSRQR